MGGALPAALEAVAVAVEGDERAGAIRSVAGDSGSRVTYLSPATMVVSGLPRCWTRGWALWGNDA